MRSDEEDSTCDYMESPPPVRWGKGLGRINERGRGRGRGEQGNEPGRPRERTDGEGRARVRVRPPKALDKICYDK